MSKRGDILAHQAFLLLRVIPFDITDLRYQILCIFRRTPYQMKSRAYLIQVSEEHWGRWLQLNSIPNLPVSRLVII